MGRRVLLVEGSDDQHVLWALFKAHQLPQTFKVEKLDNGGIESLLESIPVRLKASDLERFAVVIDADEDAQHRWQQLRGRLLTAGFTDVPATPSLHGTITQNADRLTVGAWIMPDNQIPGMLESFIAFLVPTQDRLLRPVDGFLDSIPSDVCRYPPPRRAKARIHTWLALQEEPGKPLGQAITAKYLDAEAHVVAPFLAWVRKVLVD